MQVVGTTGGASSFGSGHVKCPTGVRLLYFTISPINHTSHSKTPLLEQNLHKEL